MTLAFSREPRKTAGNRMSKLLDAEEEDDFYKTTYGGFNDVSSQMANIASLDWLAQKLYARFTKDYTINLIQ